MISTFYFFIFLFIIEVLIYLYIMYRDVKDSFLEVNKDDLIKNRITKDNKYIIMENIIEKETGLSKTQKFPKKCQELKATPSQMEEAIKRADVMVKNSASWKTIKK